MNETAGKIVMLLMVAVLGASAIWSFRHANEQATEIRDQAFEIQNLRSHAAYVEQMCRLTGG